MMDIGRQIADTQLYDGYLLWPYLRPSIARSNRRTSGCVLPRRWSAAHPDECSAIGTECLVEGGPGARVEIRARFLHVVQRQVIDSQGMPVDELTCRGERYRSWEEATERELSGIGPFSIPEGYAREPLQGGALIRRWQRLDGELSVRLEPAGRYHLLTAVLKNLTAWHGTSRVDALDHSFCRAHLLLHVVGGSFVSPLDAAAARCRHQQIWPVLVGERPDRSTILAAAIMLDEYPRVPDAPGQVSGRSNASRSPGVSMSASASSGQSR
jgi:hypothetical protein